MAFGGEAPGIGKEGGEFFFAKGGVVVLLAAVVLEGEDEGDVAVEVMGGGKDLVIEFEGDGGADFGVGGVAEDAEGAVLGILGADFVLIVVEVEGGCRFFPGVVFEDLVRFGEAAVEAVVAVGDA